MKISGAILDKIIIYCQKIIDFTKTLDYNAS